MNNFDKTVLEFDLNLISTYINDFRNLSKLRSFKKSADTSRKIALKRIEELNKKFPEYAINVAQQRSLGLI